MRPEKVNAWYELGWKDREKHLPDEKELLKIACSNCANVCLKDELQYEMCKHNMGTIHKRIR